MTGAFTKSRFVDPAVLAYAAAHSTPPDGLQQELRRVTEQRTGGASGMQSGDDQALLIEILARSLGARRAVEVGTFTGFSALALARGMGPEGRILCCDVSEEFTSIAREFWGRAGVADQVELRIGPALDTLRALPAADEFDIAFIDADKAAYPDYYEEILPRIRRGGIVIADNTLQSGRVYDDTAGDDDTEGMRRFNDRCATDPRVVTLVLPLSDGMTVIQRR